MSPRFNGTVISHDELESLAELFGVDDGLPKSVTDACEEFETDRREWNEDSHGEDQEPRGDE